MRFGSELAADLLRYVGPGIMCAPVRARAAFFEAYLAHLYGGMTAALGEQLAARALNHVAEVLGKMRPDSPSVLH